jgi:hypothetical protein
METIDIQVKSILLVLSRRNQPEEEDIYESEAEH